MIPLLGRTGSLLALAWKGVRRRALGSVLTVLSVALGTGLAITVSTAAESAEDSYDALTDASRSFDLILGPPQGSALQIVLATLFHVDALEGKFPWAVYEEMAKDERVAVAVPFAVGDSFRGHRVAGTTRAFFDTIHGADGLPLGADLRGRLFEEGPGTFEAVVGSLVAAETGLRVGDEIQVTHGIEAALHEHSERWKVVGVMRPTGTPHDRAVFMPIDAFYEIEGHEPAKPPEGAAQPKDAKDEHAADGDAGDGPASDGHAKDEHAGEEHAGEEHAADPDHECTPECDHDHAGRFVSAVGLRLKARGLIKHRMFQEIRDGRTDVQAAMPEFQVQRLKAIVGDLYTAFRWVAWLVVAVVLLGILVGLWNTIQGRRREIAILRALGARPHHVFTVIVLEAVLLCLLGGLLGLLVGRGGAYALAPLLRDAYGVRIDTAIRPFDLQVLLGLVGLGIVAGALPAWRGLRTPIAENLHPTD